jgi:hypothetical protein
MGAFNPDKYCSLRLPTELTAYWKLDETSGTREDSFGANDLTDNNTVGSTTGKVGNAAQFIKANSEYLSIADNAALSMANISFMLSCWVYADTLTDQAAIMSKGDANNSNTIEYRITFTGTEGTNRFRFGIGNGTANAGVLANSLGAPSTATWYFILCWHDAVADTINIQVNNGTVDSASTAIGSFDSAHEFTLGRYSNLDGNYWDGRIDEVGIWKNKVPTVQERSDLYNSGNGNTYDPNGACVSFLARHSFTLFE